MSLWNVLEAKAWGAAGEQMTKYVATLIHVCYQFTTVRKPESLMSRAGWGDCVAKCSSGAPRDVAGVEELRKVVAGSAAHHVGEPCEVVLLSWQVIGEERA